MNAETTIQKPEAFTIDDQQVKLMAYLEELDQKKQQIDLEIKRTKAILKAYDKHSRPAVPPPAAETASPQSRTGKLS